MGDEISGFRGLSICLTLDEFRKVAENLPRHRRAMNASLTQIGVNPLAWLIPALLIGVAIYILVRDRLKTI